MGQVERAIYENWDFFNGTLRGQRVAHSLIQYGDAREREARATGRSALAGGVCSTCPTPPADSEEELQYLQEHTPNGPSQVNFPPRFDPWDRRSPASSSADETLEGSAVVAEDPIPSSHPAAEFTEATLSGARQESDFPPWMSGPVDLGGGTGLVAVDGDGAAGTGSVPGGVGADPAAVDAATSEPSARPPVEQTAVSAEVHSAAPAAPGDGAASAASVPGGAAAGMLAPSVVLVDLTVSDSPMEVSPVSSGSPMEDEVEEPAEDAAMDDADDDDTDTDDDIILALRQGSVMGSLADMPAPMTVSNFPPVIRSLRVQSKGEQLALLAICSADLAAVLGIFGTSVHLGQVSPGILFEPLPVVRACLQYVGGVR